MHIYCLATAALQSLCSIRPFLRKEKAADGQRRVQVNKDVRRMDLGKKPDGSAPDMDCKADLCIFEARAFNCSACLQAAETSPPCCCLKLWSTMLWHECVSSVPASEYCSFVAVASSQTSTSAHLACSQVPAVRGLLRPLL